MKRYDIAAYIWLAYTENEERTLMFWREGNGEWQSVKSSVPKYPGHLQPRKPLWGYVNEADPDVMEMEINEAADHGVNVFIYDWYWFDRRPFLEQCLNDGFLGAKNNSRMQFYLMWANHNANHVWNKELADTRAGETVIWQGALDRPAFEVMAKRLIDRYFHIENYYRIGGCPVFMIYELSTLIEGFGSVETTADALSWFREEVKKAGFPDLHLQFTGRYGSVMNYSGVDGKPLSGDFYEIAKRVGADSLTHYQFVHFLNIDRDYREIVRDAVKEWKRIDETGKGLTFFPHISCGWDNNPRFHGFRPGIVKNNTPEAFEEALREAKKYVDTHDLPAPLITVNSWNEWTETSYLEPDDLYGYGYLDAIKKVFLGSDD